MVNLRFDYVVLSDPMSLIYAAVFLFLRLRTIDIRRDKKKRQQLALYYFFAGDCWSILFVHIYINMYHQYAVHFILILFFVISSKHAYRL